MEITYSEISNEVEERIIEHFGSWVRDYNCIQRGKGCFTIAAFCGEEVVGCAAVHPAQWIPPLEQYRDAFIEVIEVDKNYRRLGIASHMVKFLEEKSRDYGFRQIRAWSSYDKVEALNMWYSLNYCMRPSAMLGHSIKPGYENQQIVGYYYAKML